MRIFQVVSEVDDRSIAVDGEGKSEGDQIDDAYDGWVFSEDFWRIDDDFTHSGSSATSPYAEKNQDRWGTYTIPVTHWSDKGEVFAYMMMPNVDTDIDVTYIYFYLYDSTGTNYVVIRVIVRKKAGEEETEILIQSNYGVGWVNESAFPTREIWTPGTWYGIRFTAEITNRTFSVYQDKGNTGTWELLDTHELSTAFTSPWKTMRFQTFASAGKETDWAYETLFVDDYTFIPGPTTGNEITPAPISASCSKKMQGRGRFGAVHRDFELANYATTKDYVWIPIEVWKNDLSVKLGEYFNPRPRYRRNSYILGGPEAFGVLSQVNCDYNGILAAGEATAIGADTMTDDEAAFTAALIDKICMFTDKLSPSIDIDYPSQDADTDHFLVIDDSILDPWQETGDNTDLDHSDDIWYVRSEVDDDYYLILKFAVTNGASATAFDFTLNSFNERWTTAAEIHIYDFTNTVWRKVSDLECNAIWATYNMSDADIPAGVISDYYSGDSPPEFHVKIIAGIVAGSVTTTTRTSFAQLKTTYSTVFAAEQNNYVIDARTATELTFTGQTPQDDGLEANDRYVVGDFLHNIINHISARVAETNLTLEYDTSTNADAADYRTSTVANILNSFAKMDGRRSWQAIGWTAQSLSSYTSTGLTLTDADLIVNNDMEDWDIIRDGTEMRRHQLVVGNGTFAEGTQTPAYPCPQSFLLSSNLLSSQLAANTRMVSLLADNQSPKDILVCTVDYDNNDDVDFSVLDVGKTINVNLFSGTFTITNGLIISQEFNDGGANGHLLCTIEVETI